MLRSLDECGCSCHRIGAVHIVACCTGVSRLTMYRMVDRNVAGAIARGIMKRAIQKQDAQAQSSSPDPARSVRGDDAITDRRFFIPAARLLGLVDDASRQSVGSSADPA